MTAIDLSDNIAALVVAILRKDIDTPEEAFKKLEYKREKYGTIGKRIFTMSENGMTNSEIGKELGVSKNSVASHICRHKKLALQNE